MAEETILIIDDDDDICLAIKTLLESRGYKAETASTKEEGMEKFLSVRPDLAILDVMMASWQDGFDLSRRRRGMAAGRGVFG